MEQLICPKCQGSMRHYERSGVVVDQCSECRGIFLDRGELEKLVDAETAFHAPEIAVPRPAAAPTLPGPAYGSPGGDQYREGRSREDRPRDDHYRDDRYKDDKYRDDRYKDDKYRDDRYKDDKYRDDRYKDDKYRSSEGYYDKRKKKRSFLEDLFD